LAGDIIPVKRGRGDMRIGSGYDAHKLVANRPLILGGVNVPFEKGLLGHSDADVLTHALIDALLGASGLGDIGTMFPDDDPAYLNASSLALLAKTVGAMRVAGYEVVNADCTVVAQKPKIAGYTNRMRENLSDVLRVSPAAVSVKATTEEGMGFTGKGQGMAAYASVLIEQANRGESINEGI